MHGPIVPSTTPDKFVKVFPRCHRRIFCVERVFMQPFLAEPFVTCHNVNRVQSYLDTDSIIVGVMAVLYDC